MHNLLNLSITRALHDHVHLFENSPLHLHDGDSSCVCCRVVISETQKERVIERDATRVKRGAKHGMKAGVGQRGALQLQSGGVAGEWLCSQCVGNRLVGIWDSWASVDRANAIGVTSAGAVDVSATIIFNRRVSLNILSARISDLMRGDAHLITDDGEEVTDVSPAPSAPSAPSEPDALEMVFNLLSLRRNAAFVNLNATTYSYPGHELLGTFYRLTIAVELDNQRAALLR